VHELVFPSPYPDDIGFDGSRQPFFGLNEATLSLGYVLLSTGKLSESVICQWSVLSFEKDIASIKSRMTGIGMKCLAESIKIPR
jgi:hypothetical protein